MAHSSGQDFGCNSGESGGVFKWPTQVIEILGAILVSQVGYLSGPLKWLRFWVQHWCIRWGIYVVHSGGSHFGCNIGECAWVFK